jgi:hypothetical protein
MTFDVDGWLTGPNPAKGGGFTIVDQTGTLRARAQAPLAGMLTHFTNNDAELWAVAAGAHLAKVGDTIRSDSEVMVRWWVPRGVCKSRGDLNVLCQYAHNLIRDKRLILLWVPREENLAGLYNDSHKFQLASVGSVAGE